MASLAEIVAVVSKDGDSGSEEVMPIAKQRVELKWVKGPCANWTVMQLYNSSCCFDDAIAIHSVLYHEPRLFAFPPRFLGGRSQFRLQSFVHLYLRRLREAKRALPRSATKG